MENCLDCINYVRCKVVDDFMKIKSSQPINYQKVFEGVAENCFAYNNEKDERG